MSICLPISIGFLFRNKITIDSLKRKGNFLFYSFTNYYKTKHWVFLWTLNWRRGSCFAWMTKTVKWTIENSPEVEENFRRCLNWNSSTSSSVKYSRSFSQQISNWCKTIDILTFVDNSRKSIVWHDWIFWLRWVFVLSNLVRRIEQRFIELIHQLSDCFTTSKIDRRNFYQTCDESRYDDRSEFSGFVFLFSLCD